MCVTSQVNQTQDSKIQIILFHALIVYTLRLFRLVIPANWLFHCYHTFYINFEAREKKLLLFWVNYHKKEKMIYTQNIANVHSIPRMFSALVACWFLNLWHGH